MCVWVCLSEGVLGKTQRLHDVSLSRATTEKRKGPAQEGLRDKEKRQPMLWQFQTKLEGIAEMTVRPPLCTAPLSETGMATSSITHGTEQKACLPCTDGASERGKEVGVGSCCRSR